MKVIDKNAPERETVCSIATATSKEEDKCEKVKHSIEREVVIMKLIQHPNVIQLYDVYEDSENMYVPLSSVISSYPPQSPTPTIYCSSFLSTPSEPFRTHHPSSMI